MNSPFISEPISDCSSSTNISINVPSLPTEVSLRCFYEWNIILAHNSDNDDFNKTWSDMRLGFGSLTSDEYYLGNEALHYLTDSSYYVLRIDMWSEDNSYIHAEYVIVRVASELDFYELYIGRYNDGSYGNGGLSLEHSGSRFYTFDDDATTLNCTETYTGAWWYLEGINITYSPNEGEESTDPSCFYSILTTAQQMSWAILGVNSEITERSPLLKTVMRIRKDPSIHRGM